MELVFHTADVFTNRPFGGAQVAVFPAADGLETQQMQQIAAEFNLTETIFVFSAKTPQQRRVRIFTPRREIDFAGQTILAAGHVLGATGAIPLQEGDTRLDLLHNFGPVEVHLSVDQGQADFVQFTYTVHPVVDRFVPPDEELAAILSLDRRAIGADKFRPLLVSCDHPYLIVPIRSLADLQQAEFNRAHWAESHAPAMLAQQMLLFCRQTQNSEATFHARLVGPQISHQDDPPIGAALPAFAAYLAEQPNLRQGTYIFAVERGFDATRKSLLHVEMDKRPGAGLKLRVGGNVVSVTSGTLHLLELEE